MDSALLIVSRHTRDSVEVRTLNWLARQAEKNDTDAAMRFYHQAIDVAERNPAVKDVISSYIKIALLLSRAAQNDSARYYLDKATGVIQYYPKTSVFWSGYYNAFGLFNKNIGNYDEALKWYRNIAALSITGGV